MKKVFLFLFFVFFLSVSSVKATIFFSPETGWSWSRLVLKATATEQFAYCEQLEKEGSLNTAIDHYKLLIRVFPKSPEAIESIYRVGEILMQQKKWNLAQKYFEELLDLQIAETSKIINNLNKKKRKKKYKPTNAEKRELLDISFRSLQKNTVEKSGGNAILTLDVDRVFMSLYKIAQAYKNGARYKIFGAIPTWKQNANFVNVYRYIIIRSPNFKNSPQMQKDIAIYLLEKKDYYEAQVEFKNLLYNYSLSPEAEDAIYYLGVCRVKSSRGPAYNQENIDYAEAHMKDYLLTHPGGDKAIAAKDALVMIDEMRAENYLIKIKFFVRRNQWKAAKIYITELENKFPNSKFTLEAKTIASHNENINKL